MKSQITTVLKNVCIGNISNKLRVSISIQKELPQFNMKRNEKSNSKADKANIKNAIVDIFTEKKSTSPIIKKMQLLLLNSLFLINCSRF